MKTLLAFALLAATAASNAAVLWDSAYADASQSTLRSATTAGSAGYYYVGQVFKMASSGTYSLDSLSFDLRNLGSTTLTSQAVQVNLYATPNASAFNTSATEFDSTPVYSFSGTVSLASLAQNATGVATLAGITGVTLDSTKTYGITINTLSTSGAVPLISYGTPIYAGDSAYTGTGGGWFYDRDLNGTLAGSEYGFFPRMAYNQLGFALSGTPQAVPEPATLGALGLAATAVLRRRRRA